MKSWATHPVTVGGLLIVLLFGCGAVFLFDKAPRAWSLHWVAPQTVLVGTSNNDYALSSTPRGWDVLWADTQNHLMLSRFLRTGRRATADVRLAATSTQTALAYAGGRDVAVWREDFNGGSRLKLAILAAGKPPRYRTLAAGKQPLEHPTVLSVPGGVAVLFGWERPIFDLYLSRVSLGGSVSAPVRLTQARNYALLPRAVLDSQGLLRVIWMDQNSDGSAFNLLAERFTTHGRSASGVMHLDTIGSASGANHQSTPARWGLALSAIGNTAWAAWAGDQGITLATWQGAKLSNTQVVAPVPPPPALTLAIAGASRQLVWQQATDTGIVLFAVALDENGYPAGDADRVAFEPAIDEQPAPIAVGSDAAVAWLASPGDGSATRVEISHYSQKQLGPASFWVRLGLGLANPFAGLALLLVGGIAVGVLLTMANVLLVFLLVLLFLLTTRLVRGPGRWYGYLVFLTVLLYLLLIPLQAPFPPVIAFTALSPGLGVLAIAGMTVFVFAISRTWLNRMDDLYRAALMTFLAFYFLAFLQALVIIQGQIGKI